MEEADTLCERIGIMAGGKLRALGTPQRLKTTYGSGFKLDLTLRAAPALGGSAQASSGGPLEHESVDALVQSFCKGAGELVSQRVMGRVVTYALPKASGFDAAGALSGLQASSAKHGITDWALAQPSLEEVFINIANKYTVD